MTRKDALHAINGAGTRGDQQAFLRLYAENRIAYSLQAYREGVRFAKFIAARDAEPEPCPTCGNIYDHRFPCVG